MSKTNSDKRMRLMGEAIVALPNDSELPAMYDGGVSVQAYASVADGGDDSVTESQHVSESYQELLLWDRLTAFHDQRQDWTIGAFSTNDLQTAPRSASSSRSPTESFAENASLAGFRHMLHVSAKHFKVLRFLRVVIQMSH